MFEVNYARSELNFAAFLFKIYEGEEEVVYSFEPLIGIYRFVSNRSEFFIHTK